MRTTEIIKPKAQTDMTLFRRAARGRWAVPDRVKQRSVEEISKLIDDIDIDPKTKLDAIKTAAALDKLDLEADKIQYEGDLQQYSTEQLIEKLEGFFGHDQIQQMFPRLLG